MVRPRLGVRALNTDGLREMKLGNSYTRGCWAFVVPALIGAGLIGCSSTSQPDETEEVGSSSAALVNDVLFAAFDLGADGFAYADDGFRSSNAPAYASGAWGSGQGKTGGGLRLDLGGLDNATISGISGGFARSFTLTAKTRLLLTFDYRLSQSPHYESDERTELLASVDGALRGISPNDYVKRIVGDGENGPEITTGWVSVQVELGELPAGSHVLRLGGYNNKKTAANEASSLALDNVRVSVTTATTPPAPLACDTAACCPAGTNPVVYGNESNVLHNVTNNLCLVTAGGSDVVFSSASGTTVLGGDGDDTITAGAGAKVRAGAGRDTVNGFSSSTVLGGPGDDTITAANGTNFIYPGAGIDTVAGGTGDDTVVIYDLCEVSWGDRIDAGTGFDTLITPVPVAQLTARGVTIANFEKVVVQANSCKSECVDNACSSHGTCQEGSSTGQIKCACEVGRSGASCQIDGEPTAYPESPGKPIQGYSFCQESGFALVDSGDPAHPERRKIAYGSAAPGCEPRFCRLDATGVEQPVASPSEAELNAAPAAGASCPAMAPTQVKDCAVNKKTLLPGSCVNDVDCPATYVCARVCLDESCGSSTKQCGKPSESCAGLPSEGSCDNVGFRMCSEPNAVGATSATLLDTAAPEVKTPPAAPVPRVLPPYVGLSEVDACRGPGEPLKAQQDDPWNRGDDGSSTFGIYFEPTLNQIASFTPRALGQATFEVGAGAGFRAGVKVFGKELDALVADAHAKLSTCERDVKASIIVLGDEIVAENLSVENDALKKACGTAEGLWIKALPALTNANRIAREARQQFDKFGPTKALCGRVRDRLLQQLDPNSDVQRAPDKILTDISPDALDCDNAPESAAVLATNILIESYSRWQQNYLSSFADYKALRQQFSATDSRSLGSRTPFSIFGYSQTFFVGPIPITIDARVFGEYGINGGISYALELGAMPKASGDLNIGPHFAIQASIFAGVGIPAASIGVEGKLNLITVDPSLKVGITLQGQVTADPRSLDGTAWAGPALLGFPQQAVKWQVPWHYGAYLDLQSLDGTFDAVARINLFFFKKTFRKNIFRWSGLHFRKELTSGGSDSPMARSAEDSSFGQFGDLVGFTGVAPVSLADAPSNGDVNAIYFGTMPGDVCTQGPK
jgi:Ca2+-binding RTX toxin-like protein